MEQIYRKAVQKEIIEAYLKIEIPARSIEKLKKLVEKGTSVFRLY